MDTSSLKCRWELGKVRWNRVKWTQKGTAIASFFALLIMLCIPYPEDNDAALVAVLITAFFFIFLLLITMSIIWKRINIINREERNLLNAIRRKYGVEEK